MRLFIFGLGYSARAIIAALRPHCSWVGGTTRTAEKAIRWRQEGVEAFVFDTDLVLPEEEKAILLAYLCDATHLLISIAPDPERRPEEGGDQLLPFLKTHTPWGSLRKSAWAWIGYLSSVSVYGDHAGEWVEETTRPRPGLLRGKTRLAAEQAWTAFAKEQGVFLSIFRLAGIYGPGRSALEALRARRARCLIKEGQVFNRIHVTDIGEVVACSALQKPSLPPFPFRIYNLADHLPAPPQEVMRTAAALLGYPPPLELPFEEASLSPITHSFYSENKRVSNARIRKELDYVFRYPSYKEGLAALLESEV